MRPLILPDHLIPMVTKINLIALSFFSDIWMKRGDGGESVYGPVFEGKLMVNNKPCNSACNLHISSPYY